MRKKKYSGKAEGLYDPHNFRWFMEQRKRVEVVSVYDSMVPYSDNKKLIAVYHVYPQHVTVGYSFSEVRPIEDQAHVALFGSRKAISEVERIIHQAERKYQASRRA